MKTLGLTSCCLVSNARRVHLVCSAVQAVANSRSQHVMRGRHQSLGAFPLKKHSDIHSTSAHKAKAMPAKGTLTVRITYVQPEVVKTNHRLSRKGLSPLRSWNRATFYLDVGWARYPWCRLMGQPSFEPPTSSLYTCRAQIQGLGGYEFFQ
jgi:hypothetical protein